MAFMPLSSSGTLGAPSPGGGQSGLRAEFPVDPLRAGSPSRGQYKHGFPMRGRKGSSRLSGFLFFERVVAVRKDASDVVDSIIPLARIYQQNFLDRHMILDFGGVSLDVCWRKRHFMHLCGLDCTVPQRMYRSGGRVVKSEVFFDALLDGKTKELKPVHGHNVGITRDKLSVLPRLLESPDGIEGMVESASRDYDFFFGSELWCAGITASDEQPVDPDAGVYAARTLRSISIMSRSVRAAGSVLRRLDGCRIIPPRVD